jgi:hypothetical protein
MGLLAFYGGLIIGTLVGMVIISVISMGLGERDMPELPDRPDEYFRERMDLRQG